MIRREGFVKGEQVEFQDYRRCWVRGVVQAVDAQATTMKMDNLVVLKPAEVHVLYTTLGKPRIVKLNPKRVRRVQA